MNRLLTVLLLALTLALTLTAAAQAKPAKAPPPKPQATTPGEAAAPPASFHGIPWGTRLADVKDMEVMERNGPAAYAKVKGAPPRIADIAVNDLVYAFCNDQFAGSMATFQGRDRYDAILSLLSARYGQPVRPSETTDNLGWPLGDVLIMLEFDAPIAVGSLSYLHALIYAPCAAPPDQAPAPGVSPGASPAAAPKTP